MRTAFILELVELARIRRNIFLVVGDLGFSVIEPFAREFPDRFLNAGVAEQNMTGLAAGLASEGYHVFTYSIGNFPTLRCAEQIRNDIAYHKLPVTVVSVGGGLAYGNLGYSHHAVQDMALMRSFPNMLIAAPGDPYETRACVKYLTDYPQASYLRLGKAGEPIVHKNQVNVSPGELIFIQSKPRPKKLILTTGATLKLASDAIQQIITKDWVVASLPLWSEALKPQIAERICQFTDILTIENHLQAGGFGSYIRETIGDTNWCGGLRSIALNVDVCGKVASETSLNQIGGLNLERVSIELNR